MAFFHLFVETAFVHVIKWPLLRLELDVVQVQGKSSQVQGGLFPLPAAAS